MDKMTAAQLLDHAVTTAGANGAYLYRIANGEYVVRIRAKDFWLWTWQDLTVYAHDLKKRRNRERKAADRAAIVGISPQEVYRAILFA
jgi:hypothetical protein